MSARKLDILIEQLRNDGNSLEIVPKSEMSDVEQVYNKTDRSWIWKKWIFVSIVWIVNILLIFSVIFTRWGIYLVYPFITLPHIRDVIYVLATIGSITFKRYTATWGKRSEVDYENTHVTLASIVTAYSEDYNSVKDNVDELMTVVKSKKGIGITNLIICVCDGMAIGSGNPEPLCDMFFEDMVVTQPPITRYYETWKGDICKSTLYYGDYGHANDNFNQNNTNKLLLIKKNKNHGKKDGLLLAKCIIDDINNKKIVLDGMQLPIQYVYSTDADTVTHKGSLERGVEWMEEYPELDAGVFILRVKFQRDKKCNWFWDHFQSFQYFSSQYVRRSAESVFGKVTCLSGSGNICRVSSKSYKYANVRYAEYPRTTSLMDVAPKMIGTDRRYTTLKLKYSRDVKLVMLYDTIVETETPQNLRTYISQRKRWGTNTLSNSLVNIGSRNIPWYTKISGIIDIFRLIASYFRFTSYFYFWVFLFTGKINPAILILVGVTVGFVYIYSFIAIFVVNPPRLWLTMLYGFVANKLLTPLITVRIFTEILLNFDDFTWGATQRTKGQLDEGLDLELGLQDVTTNTLNRNMNSNGENQDNDKYSNLEDVRETEDGMLYIKNHPDKNKRRLKKQKKFRVVDADNDVIVIDGDGNQKFAKKRYKKKRNNNTEGSSESSDNSYDTPLNRGPVNRKISEDKIPKSLKEIDNIQHFEDEDSTSEVEIKYSSAWKEKHFPREEEMHPPTHTPVSDNTNQTNDVPPPPPPPPPPPGSDLNLEVAKVRTKKIHWKPLPPDVAQKSFWRLSDSTLLITDVEKGEYTHTRTQTQTQLEIEKLFEISEAKKVVKATKKGETLVNAKRANNSSIILNRIRRRFNTDEQCLDVIMKALVHLNPQQISLDQLQGFMSFFPLTENELVNLNSFEGDRDIIFADKFFVQTLNIPRLHERMQCEIIKRTIKPYIDHIDKYCTVVQNSCVELKESTKFKSFMKMVLKYGKILNNDNTIGFKLESLLLLKETKASSKTKTHEVKTFLDYIIKIVKEQHHELLLFVQDMPSLEKVEDISLITLKSNLAGIAQEFDFLKKQVGIALKEDKKGENSVNRKMAIVFLKNYFKFYKHIKARIVKCNTNLKEAEEIVKGTMEYYGEKYPELSAQDFFRIITQFIQDVKHNKLFSN